MSGQPATADAGLDRARRYAITISAGAHDPFVARVAEFPRTIGAGDTPEEAAAELLELLADTIEVLEQDGQPVPEPLDSFTGVLRLREPKSLHQALQQHAAAEGVSLDQAASVLLTRALAAESLVDPPRRRGGPPKAPAT
jgi:predicted RNase H-like HicB family nuclease